MTRKGKLKKKIRAYAQRTGTSYIAARRAILASALAPALAGCDEASQPLPTGTQWVVNLNISSPDSSIGYVQMIDSPQDPVEHDREGVFEMPSAGSMMMVPGERAFIHASYDEPVIRRYDVDDHGIPTETRAVSFLNFGVPHVAGFFTESPTELWFAAYSGLDLFRVDPTTMEITASVLLRDVLGREPYPDAWAGDKVLRDGKLYIGVGYENWTDLTALPATVILVLDLETLGHEVYEDNRCAMGMPAAMGDELIVAPSAEYVSGYLRFGYEGFDREPCMLRLGASGDFDPGYLKPLSDWTGGAPTASVEVISETVAFAKVFDESLSPGPEDPWNELFGNHWRWASFNPSSDEPAQILPGEPSSGRFFLGQSGGLNWTVDQFFEDNRSTLRILDETGIREGARFTGVATEVGKLGE